MPGGEFQTSVLRGRVFEDINRDSIDNDEGGVQWILVQLRTPEGQLVAQTRSAADGSYSFGDVQPGDYVLRFGVDDDGRTFVTPNSGDDDSIDSDAVMRPNGRAFTEVISVGAGEEIDDLDAGMAFPEAGTIRGRVFEDVNGNGIDDGEPGIPGVALRLSAFMPLPDEADTLVFSQADGSYSFTGLPFEGSYVIEMPDARDDEAAGRVLAPANVGNDDRIDSDFFYYREGGRDDPGSWGAPGIVLRPEAPVAEDIDLGLSPLPDDPDRGEIRGRVFLDLNGNGIDDGEPGVRGIRVELNRGEVDVRYYYPVRVDITDENGEYAFGAIGPTDGASGPAGGFTVQFSRPFEGYALSDFNQGDDDSVDSDGPRVEGIAITPAQIVRDIDLGLIPLGADDFVLI